MESVAARQDSKVAVKHVSISHQMMHIVAVVTKNAQAGSNAKVVVALSSAQKARQLLVLVAVLTSAITPITVGVVANLAVAIRVVLMENVYVLQAGKIVMIRVSIQHPTHTTVEPVTDVVRVVRSVVKVDVPKNAPKHLPRSVLLVAMTPKRILKTAENVEMHVQVAKNAKKENVHVQKGTLPVWVNVLIQKQMHSTVDNAGRFAKQDHFARLANAAQNVQRKHLWFVTAHALTPKRVSCIAEVVAPLAPMALSAKVEAVNVQEKQSVAMVFASTQPRATCIVDNVATVAMQMQPATTDNASYFAKTT